jgi:hypothetical protein
MSATIETIGPGAVDPRAEQEMVPMRDGVHLAIDVYRSDGQAPWPAVLVRLPYDKNGRYCWMPQIGRHFTDRGYAFLVQDVRGKFRSGGEADAFVHEIDDGYDTIQWITRQPWSDGAVGMWGDSYYGFTQWTAVASGHPALRAIVPRVTVADLFDWLDGVTPLYGAHYLAQYWSDRLTHHWTPDWTHRPLCELFDEGFEAIGSRSIAFDRMLAEERGAAGVDLYATGHPFDRLRIPTLHGVGWFDNITPGHMLDYERLMADPATAPYQYLHAGSTDHENYRFDDVPIGEADDHATNNDALERMLPLYLRPALDFFDAFLAGRTDPASVPRVRWHLGNDRWHESPAWPPPGARESRLHLSAGGGRAGPAGRAGLGARPGRPRPVDDRGPFLVSLRVPGRDRGRRQAGRRRVHGRAAGRGAHARRPRGCAPVGRKRRAVDVRPREAHRRGSGRHLPHPALRAGARPSAGGPHGGAGVPGAHRPPDPARPPPPAPDRLERLPALRPPPGHRREPLVRGRDRGEPPARPHGRVGPVAREPHGPRIVLLTSRPPGAGACRLRSFSPSGSAGTMVRMSLGWHA